MSDWETVKPRTSADSGAVWYSPGEGLYRRTGGPEVEEEGRHQLLLADLGFPVPRPIEVGATEEGHYFTEPETGERNLHERALAQAAGHDGKVDDTLVDTAADISSRLLRAQSSHPVEDAGARARSWYRRAGFVDEVFAENPDLDTERIRTLLETAVDRLARLPLCHSNLDYGLPNAFPDAVIDWQHHCPAPLGYDVYPMLDIAAFKGGGRRYTFTAEQRARYTRALDETAQQCTGRVLSPHLGDFLLIKCFFFLARMRPREGSRPEQFRKWHYRRALLTLSAQEYADTRRIETADFPSRDDFESRYPGP